MNRAIAPILIAAGLGLVVAANTLFIVPQTQQALVLQFGAIDRVINTVDGKNGGPGLYMKAPFVQNVQFYDRRNLGFNLQEQAIVASDQQRLIVDAYARWQISDPLRFRQAAQDEETGRSRLENVMTGALRRVLGDLIRGGVLHTLPSFVIADGKTKSFVAAVDALSTARRILIIADSFDEKTYLSARNVSHVLLMTANEVNVEQMLLHSDIFVVGAALETLAKRTA
jgi:regulator of protease activity HflC (stomatin/prohibitin superfamily)